MLSKHNVYALGFALTALTACSSNNSSDESDNSIDWQPCESNSALECGTIAVPMNYQDQSGEQISIALIRQPAINGASDRSLLFNPGGPGGSGVEVIELLHEIDTIPDSIQATYNLVGFDPRGIGGSSPVDCGEFGLDNIIEYPRSRSDVELLHGQYTSFAADCAQKYGDYLQHLGSLNVVRDMEEIRSALGEDKLNFIGYSYGTRLAGLYLQQYPESSGRIILDASVHPESSVERLGREALPAIDANLRYLVAQCIDYDSNCNIDMQFSSLADRVSTLADDPSDLAGMEFSVLSEILIAAATEPAFAELAGQTIHNYLMNSDLATLLGFIQQLDQNGEEGMQDNETAQIAVLCADDGARPTPDSLDQLRSELNEISDIAAEAQLTSIASCAGWPAALEPLPLIGSSIAPTSLVIGGTSDALTPLAWSETMAAAIGGIYIRSEHQGHTVVFVDESDCIDNLAEQFLLDGLAPTTTECVTAQ